MCKRVKCPECDKYTWAGCGLHIEQALAGLSDEEICKCKEEKANKQQETIPALVNTEW